MKRGLQCNSTIRFYEVFILLHMHTCTFTHVLNWLMEYGWFDDYEARLVAFVGTNITRGDGTEGCNGNKRSYGRRGVRGRE